MSSVTPTLTTPPTGAAFTTPPGPSIAAPTTASNQPPAKPTRPGNPDTVSLSPDAQQASEQDPKPAQTDLNAPRGTDGEPLSDAEQKQVEELKQRDREVKAHEQAHKNAAGPYATSGPTYTYQTGPDGKRYAVGGSVGIDVSPEDTPEETIQKMDVVRRAALAPAEPSAQDRRVAAQATRTANQARQELNAQRQAEATGNDTDQSTDPTAPTSAGAPADASVTTTTDIADAFRSQPATATLVDLIA